MRMREWWRRCWGSMVLLVEHEFIGQIRACGGNFPLSCLLGGVMDLVISTNMGWLNLPLSTLIARSDIHNVEFE